MLPSFLPAVLALADGTVFHGWSVGAGGTAIGEVVFNTAMTGYQEVLSDPSYSQQLITFTYPHIGNVGINDEDIESNQVYAAGAIIRSLPNLESNYRRRQSFLQYMSNANKPVICGVDTRKLTNILREKGAQNACLMAGEVCVKTAINYAKSYKGLVGLDLAKLTSTPSNYSWTQANWHCDVGYTHTKQFDRKIVVFDYGIKLNILRMLAKRNCEVMVVPAQTPWDEIIKLCPDGILLSNGPGDPDPCDYAIHIAQQAIASKMPIFGICLGHQIMGLALGAKTIKMKTGHHGANHPVLDLKSKRVLISSQNHGFAIDPSTLPANAKITHLSLFDGSLQGFKLIDAPAFCFQGHPEASPGPTDAEYLFDQFINVINQYRLVSNSLTY